jgi:hypothetical protein
MRSRSIRGSAALAAALAIALVVLACDPAEPVDTPSPSPQPSSTVDPSAAAEALLLEPWRPAPLIVPPNLLDSVEYVCKNQEDPDAVADLPVVLVDARGGALASVILADDNVAFECRVKLEIVGEGLGATILDGPTRLVPDSTTPVDEDGIRVISHTRVDEETGSRSILIGRVGPKAFSASVGFNDESWIEASKSEGWFYVWWPGNKEPGAIVSADARSVVQQSAPTPEKQVEGRVGPASWWVAPAALPLPAETTVIPAQLREVACASGRSPEGRVLDPLIFSSEDAVLVTFWVRRSPGGGQDCQGNPEFATLIQLPEPLGDRKLLDGSEVPPRDATTPPK